MTICDYMKTLEGFYHLTGTSDDLIVAAEDELNLRFAEDYRDYLAKFGLATYGSHEFTGLCDSTRLNVVDATKREREENEYIDDDMYLLEQIGVENYTIWQNTQGEVFGVCYKQQPKKISDSLEGYIRLSLENSKQ